MIADVHCHTFNGDDIPVRGFLEQIALREWPLRRELALIVDAAVQRSAPGFAAENAKLDLLLAKRSFGETYGIQPPELADDLAADLERQANELLRELEMRRPEQMRRLTSELATDGAPAEQPRRSLSLGRWARWATLFSWYRLDITRYLAQLFDRVDLFTPLLVDLELGLGDSATTTLEQQVVLHEKISRLSMLGKVGSGSARVHPFVAFDPRRELRAQVAEDVEPPFEVVRKAIARYGFVGVKVYPPMGWRPIGNKASAGMSEAAAQRLDEILREFYGWCANEDVPITAHCNKTVYAHCDYKGFGSPEEWVEVLEKFPGLRVNLGHFGGARKEEPASGWPWRIARAAAKCDGLYADVGNHEIHDDELTRPYLAMLKKMMAEDETQQMKSRLMFGSDWYMVALYPEHERFVDEYERLYRDCVDAAATPAFMGRNALSFLGFDDPSNKNAQRLRARYDRYVPNDVPEWLAPAA